MVFTYSGYRNLISRIKESDYEICNYHNYVSAEKCAILRHDIDNSSEAALRLGKVEETMGVHSTWFVLITSNFYNPASAECRTALKELQSMGHEIGLHFDEMAYGEALPSGQIIAAIQKEAAILSQILETPVTTVSMHRPSKETLDANLEIPGMVNSYGKTFFHDFKYLSDSRHRWRESVEDVIKSGKHNRLHILTHAFWYHEQEETIEETVGNFIRSANRERYEQMREHITDLSSIIPEVV